MRATFIVVVSHSRLCKAVAPKPEGERLAAARATKASAWKKVHKDFMASLGCSVDFKPWTSLAEIERGGVSQTDRAKAILDCAWTERIHVWSFKTFDDARVGLHGGVEPVECMPAERSSGVASTPAHADIDSRKSVIVSSF